MLEHEHAQIQAVREWVEKAESDLALASLALRHAGQMPVADGVCFHAQQCTEKYLKALLTWQGIRSPRSHNLEEFIALLPEHHRPSLSLEEQRALVRYAVITRYPGDYEPITQAEARQAVTLARRARREIRKWLPKEALKPARQG